MNGRLGGGIKPEACVRVGHVSLMKFAKKKRKSW